MTREEAQDAALKLAADWRKISKTIDEKRTYIMPGQQLKAWCNHMEIITDSVARIVEDI